MHTRQTNTRGHNIWQFIVKLLIAETNAHFKCWRVVCVRFTALPANCLVGSVSAANVVSCISCAASAGNQLFVLSSSGTCQGTYVDASMEDSYIHCIHQLVNFPCCAKKADRLNATVRDGLSWVVSMAERCLVSLRWPVAHQEQIFNW